jgi:hypothetical protein
MTSAICPVCGISFLTENSNVKRCRQHGYEPRCSRECAGVLRRNPNPPSDEEARTAKAAYDKARRTELREELAAKKRAAYYARHAEHLASQAEERKSPEFRAKMRAYQKEHSAQPEWKKYKHAYDRVFRANEAYGPEWGPVHVALMELRDAIKEAMPDRIERYRRIGKLNKSQTRRRNGTSKAQRSRA